MDQLKMKLKFTIPEGIRKTACRGCGNPIYFVPTRSGKFLPVDPDGTAHWATCPNSDQFRKDKKP